MGARGKLVGFDPEGKPIYAPKLTTAQKLLALKPWMRLTYNRHDFQYQSCRFCKRSIHETGALWQYSVRHYACDECRDRILKEDDAGARRRLTKLIDKVAETWGIGDPPKEAK